MLTSAMKNANRLLAVCNMLQLRSASNLPLRAKFFHQIAKAPNRGSSVLRTIDGAALKDTPIYTAQSSPISKVTWVMQGLPFISVFFEDNKDPQRKQDSKSIENALPMMHVLPVEESKKSVVEELLEMHPVERYETANKLLTELTINLDRSVLAAVSLNSLAARLVQAFDEEMVIFAHELSNCTSHDSVSDDMVLRLLEFDRDLQLTLIKAQKNTLEAKNQMNALGRILGELCCSIIPLSKEAIEKAKNGLKEAHRELKEVEDFLSHSVNSSGPPDALLSQVIRLTADMEEDMSFSLAGLCSMETQELYNRSLALQLEQFRAKTEKQIADDLNKRFIKLKKFFGKEGERQRLGALLDCKEEDLRKSLDEKNYFQRTQLTKKLEQKVLEERQDCIQKATKNHEASLRAKKFTFDRELKEKADNMNNGVENWKLHMVGELAELGPSIKRHGLNIKKFGDVFGFANTCFKLQLALTTDPFPQLSWKHQLQPIKHYIIQILGNDAVQKEFVQKVVNSIPAPVFNRGVYTENALKQRFTELEPIARKVLLLKQKDNSLVPYIASYLRSALLVRPAGCISHTEKVNQPRNLSSLTNEQLLDRAKYFMELGDLRQAVLYVNMLHGVAQCVTSGWAEEVVLHLTVSQAAETLSGIATMLANQYKASYRSNTQTN
ncbi:MICOS complex subunit Mic60-like [Neocloeon triangulifer]|uniref:MICOS complex subunit Mic60-like n=1 Tax=Neocloeon triangulifer TaxID=2078957 RepID=UPI00286EBFB2|nr:MICOS complex subunit Mic60-like [Neocloeon triangulifer]XP_059479686.1 MICOS complex subunit Mic60-like [Neocloeon triangulifer]XP_059479687.1 MICOS complex subunit Mic60-like [Neocloeon triangulifer]XP_059479688.1 MICOS complex subunit Mic60-like [Neocloeon triangulifer]XP_059479689.1 MICOS complex subunit Mic60-like [Neocloeon triangulifer]XP_059479690.1 MICOS complex subunit Mic60-like [Neocloeon triangulifer]XP_059479691.1 MICOS complex subunit Mic60-like [Neocloeon triangulifer]XP_0